MACHCHTEPLICAVNVETAAAWILFVISLHVAPLASTFDAQCFACVMCDVIRFVIIVRDARVVVIADCMHV